MPETASTATAKRILFVSESVTLAHVARPAALFDCVDRQRFDPYFACASRSRRFLTIDSKRLLSIDSLDSPVFADRLRRGVPVYEAATLRAYVAADFVLIDQVEPDLIVGDFRLSLSVSARVAGVPYATITNAYWSPHAPSRRLPLPVLPWTRYAPIGLAELGFGWIEPFVLAPHCRPLNQVRAEHGLKPLPDIRHVYTDADYVLYADDPTLFPVVDAPVEHRYLGPLIWSPPMAVPGWWNDLPDDMPLVYVTMGSSGRADLLDVVFDALSSMNMGVVCATAGAKPPPPRPNVWHADFLPGAEAAAKACLVICNGGAPTSQQALLCGVPVIGICANMDQMLNMRGLSAAGVGIGLRADRLTSARIVAAMQALELGAARKTNRSSPNFKARFPSFLDDVLT